jgi:hypothetical protein
MGTNINRNGNGHLKEVQMKTSMMKLSVFVMMASIVMFALVAMASADDHKWKHGIDGDYAVTGTNSCVIAPGGFSSYGETVLTPKGDWQTVQGYILGIFTFHHDGSGQFRSRTTVSLQPNPTDPTTAPLLIESHFDYNFTYKVTGDGVISFHVLPCAGGPGSWSDDGPHDGVISPDGQSLIVYCGSPPVLLNQCTNPTDPGDPTTGSCSDGVGDPDCTLSGTQLACGIQMQGFRIKKPFDPFNIAPCPE